MSAEPLKCLIWDLDDTLWSGTLIEGDACPLRPGVREVLETLDARGVLQSVASRSDETLSTRHLEARGVLEFFLHPRMSLEASKPDQILEIAEVLRVDLSQVGFVDDDPFQRAQVEELLPDVRVFEPGDAAGLLAAFEQPVLSGESAGRRAAFRAEEQRRAAESRFEGPRAEFLRGCAIHARLRDARPGDATRIAELSLRTHRMNASERRFDLPEVEQAIGDSALRLRVLSLRDRFGDLGTVGVTWVDRGHSCWRMRSLMVSCRALGRGVGEALLVDVLEAARKANARGVEARFRATEVNRGMGLLFARQGFSAAAPDGAERVLRHALERVPALPGFIEVSEG